MMSPPRSGRVAALTALVVFVLASAGVPLHAAAQDAGPGASPSPPPSPPPASSPASSPPLANGSASKAAKATATCERSVGPGRVRCDAEITSDGGAVVRWADVQIVETPAFVSALKGRIGPADTTLREKDKWRFSFGLVARGRGTGEVKLRVRAVICRADSCEGELIPLTVSVAAGT